MLHASIHAFIHACVFGLDFTHKTQPEIENRWLIYWLQIPKNPQMMSHIHVVVDVVDKSLDDLMNSILEEYQSGGVDFLSFQKSASFQFT